MTPNPDTTRPSVSTRTVTPVIFARSEIPFHHSPTVARMVRVILLGGGGEDPARPQGRAGSDLRRLEHVAEAALRLDDRLRRVGVELAAQVRDVRLHDAGVAVEVVLPDVVEDLRLREHAVGVE